MYQADSWFFEVAFLYCTSGNLTTKQAYQGPTNQQTNKLTLDKVYIQSRTTGKAENLHVEILKNPDLYSFCGWGSQVKRAGERPEAGEVRPYKV